MCNLIMEVCGCQANDEYTNGYHNSKLSIYERKSIYDITPELELKKMGPQKESYRAKALL